MGFFLLLPTATTHKGDSAFLQCIYSIPESWVFQIWKQFFFHPACISVIGHSANGNKIPGQWGFASCNEGYAFKNPCSCPYHPHRHTPRSASVPILCYLIQELSQSLYAVITDMINAVRFRIVDCSLCSF